MYDPQTSSRGGDAWRDNDSSKLEEVEPSLHQGQPSPFQPPPPPTTPPYQPPIESTRSPGYGQWAPPTSSAPGPPPVVPIEQLYSEPAQPVRHWLRIPLSKPLFTNIILVVLVGIYVPMLFSNDIANTYYDFGAKINDRIVEGEWWRLFTATLLHAQTPVHLLLNGYALFMLGLELEAFMGKWRFLAIYWLSALGGSVASFAFSAAPGVGASGAVFGLIGALAVYFGLHRTVYGKLGQAQFWNIIVVIVLNLGIGFSRIFPIDNAAHVGGLVVGAAVGYAMCPRYALGGWRLPNVRDIKNVNTGNLAWLAVTLIALDVIFAFFVALLLYKNGYWALEIVRLR